MVLRFLKGCLGFLFSVLQISCSRFNSSEVSLHMKVNYLFKQRNHIKLYSNFKSVFQKTDGSFDWVQAKTNMWVSCLSVTMVLVLIGFVEEKSFRAEYLRSFVHVYTIYVF